MNKKIALFALLIGAPYLTFTKGTIKKTGKIEYLYVLQAGSGTLTDSTLTIQKPHSHVLAFSDRPYRTCYHMKSTEFLKTFNATFKGDPPNGALIAENIKGKDPVAIELKNPIRKGKKWVFKVHSIKNKNALRKQSDLKNVILFIDGGCHFRPDCSNNPCNRENC